MPRTGGKFTEKHLFFKEDSEKSQFNVKISAFPNKSKAINAVKHLCSASLIKDKNPFLNQAEQRINDWKKYVYFIKK